MLRKPPLVLALALLVYVVYRALVLHTNFDAVALPVYEQFFGNIGEVARAGWYGPPLSQYYDNCGGHLVVGLLSAPVFAIFGPSFLSLKLIPVALGFLTLIGLWKITRREFDLRTANLTAAFFAIGPPTLAKYSMLAKGNHFENLFFQLLALWAFYRLHRFAAGSPERRRGLLIFGACAGFAVFFYFGSLVLLALLAVMHLMVRGVRGAIADLALLIPAGLVGVSPLLWIQLSGGARPSTFLGSHFRGSGGGGVQAAEIDRVARLKEFFGDFLPRATCYEDLGPVSGDIANWIYLAVFLAAWLYLMPRLVRGALRAVASFKSTEAGTDAERETRRFEDLKTFPLLGYLPAFVVLYGVSRFEFDLYLPPVEIGQFRYLVPHYMFSCVVVAVAAARLLSVSGLRARAGWALAAVMLALQLFSLPVIDFSFSKTGFGTRYPGYDFALERNVLQRDRYEDPVTGAFGWDMPKMVAQIDEFPRREKQESSYGMGYYCAWSQVMPAGKRATQPRKPGLHLGELVEPFAQDMHIDLARGAGTYLREAPGADGSPPARLSRQLPRLLNEDNPLLPYMIEGLAMHADFWLSSKVRQRFRLSRSLGGSIPAELRYAWWRGQGIMAGRLLVRGIEADRNAVIELLGSGTEAGLPELWFGMGFGLGESLVELDAPPEMLELVPEELAEATVRGLGAGLRHRLGLERAGEVFTAWRSALEAKQRGALEVGLRWPDYPTPQRLGH